jgi:lysophospholipase L1-like esterase
MKPFYLLFLLAGCNKSNLLVPSKSGAVTESVRTAPLFDTTLNVICAGNSLTVGYRLDSPATQAYPAQLQPLINGTTFNDGVNGITTEQMEPLISSDIKPRYDSLKKNIVIAWEIGNDIFWNGATAKAAYDSFVVYCNAVTASGFKVYAVTLPYRNNYYLGYPITPGGDDSTSYTAKIKSVNSMLRSKWPTFASGLIDVAANRNLKAYSSTYYIFDHVHLSAAGYTIVASLAADKLNPVN